MPTPAMTRKFMYQNQNLRVDRPIYQLRDLHRESRYQVYHVSFRERIRTRLRSISPVDCLLDTVPVVRWLPHYNWKKHLIPDVISGITVFILQIPQGMAYGMLANAPAVVGLYMAFYQVLIYFVFGTSRHVSMGTFAITCLMVGKVVSEQTTVEILSNGTKTVTNPELLKQNGEVTDIDIGITIAFASGLAQLVMYIFRMGALCNLLSDSMVSGFTCAAAYQVLGSQLKDLLGLKITKRTGNFALLLTFYDVFLDLPHGNKTVMIVSAVSCACLLIYNELIKRQWAKISKLPFPIELLIVIFAGFMAHFASLHEKYGLNIIGIIPVGLPSLTIPKFNMLSVVWIDALVIALVSYAITMSMAFIFARKLLYEVSPNQDLLAHALSNIIGSFCMCLTTAASLSRSAVQEQAGGVTQIAGVVSSILMLFVLLWLAPLLETLPKCVLASLIVIALQALMLQVRELPLYWRLSRWDGTVWTITFLATFNMQISVGLAIGLAASVLSIAIQGLRLDSSILGQFSGTDLYLDIATHKAVTELPGIKIVHFVGGISFASRGTFRQMVATNVGFDPAEVLRQRALLLEKGLPVEDEGLNVDVIILDFSSLTFVDPSGVACLRQLQVDLDNLDITLLIAECSGRAFKAIDRCDKYENKESKFLMLPSIHDAVMLAQTAIIKP